MNGRKEPVIYYNILQPWIGEELLGMSRYFHPGYGDGRLQTLYRWGRDHSDRVREGGDDMSPPNPPNHPKAFKAPQAPPPSLSCTCPST